MKKLVAILLAAVLVLGFASAASAAPGWQYLGTNWHNHYSTAPQTSKVYVEQDGGNIGIRVDYRTKVTEVIKYRPKLTVMVFEDDAVGQTLIGHFTYDPWTQYSDTYSFNIDKYRDGSNKKAEIYYIVRANYIGNSVISVVD